VYKLFLSLALPGTSWGFLLLLYVFIQMTRVVVVGVCYPLLRYFGYGLDFKETTVIVWSGLRGAVSLSLALSVKVSYLSCISRPPHLSLLIPISV
jgi:NhaP-type Na+/H+ or K+/H+ antiporter